jgi:hypothetical protein
MRRVVIAAVLALLIGSASLFIPGVRSRVKAVIRPEPPPLITPLALTLPQHVAAVPSRSAALAGPAPTTQSTNTPTLTVGIPARTARPVPTAVPSPTLAPSPTPGPVVVNGRTYDVYIPAASKEHQAYKYSCEFDAAWVILQTYGINTQVDDLIAAVGVDTSIEPYIKETKDGFLVYGGDITQHFSGNIEENFLARSTGSAMRKAFERYHLRVTPVNDRAGVEAALRAGELVWIKTTVDFKPWRPATWALPDGRLRLTVLGNESLVIRDVLGPTSSNWNRPYEYEVAWPTFLAAWGAQEFDGLAVAPPQ